MQAVHLLEGNYDIGDILNIKVFDADKNPSNLPPQPHDISQTVSPSSQNNEYIADAVTGLKFETI